MSAWRTIDSAPTEDVWVRIWVNSIYHTRDTLSKRLGDKWSGVKKYERATHWYPFEES